MILHFVDEKKETLSFHFPSGFRPSVLPSFRSAEGKGGRTEHFLNSAILN
jgi:hypothetical protein